mmetsp:Transcript_35102/g.34126  ORF Transcript_35102/g.34126 Transcript_35102/m.34126 type:complete len:159 (-) Transcript_35102:201-677(-)
MACCKKGKKTCCFCCSLTEGVFWIGVLDILVFIFSVIILALFVLGDSSNDTSEPISLGTASNSTTNATSNSSTANSSASSNSTSDATNSTDTLATNSSSNASSNSTTSIEGESIMDYENYLFVSMIPLVVIRLIRVMIFIRMRCEAGQKKTVHQYYCC